jgi:hypothetical protein
MRHTTRHPTRHPTRLAAALAITLAAALLVAFPATAGAQTENDNGDAGDAPSAITVYGRVRTRQPTPSRGTASSPAR